MDSCTPSKQKRLAAGGPAGTPKISLEAMRFLLFTLAALCGALTTPTSAQVRVACIGDSITYGARIDDREHHTYPARLQHRLGGDFEVRNFGLSGRTLRSAADMPYVAEPLFQDVIAWRPDVAIVLLGTNDTFLSNERPNWIEGHDFTTDLRAITQPLHQNNSKLRVIIASSPPIAVDMPGLARSTVAEMNQSIPRLEVVRRQMREIARTTGHYEFVDLSRLLEPHEYIDGYHPTPFGADRIAVRIADAVRSAVEVEVSMVERLSNLRIGFEPSTRFGLQTAELLLPPRGAQLEAISVAFLQPELPLEGRPWVVHDGPIGPDSLWYRDLVDRGFHVAVFDSENRTDDPFSEVLNTLGGTGLGKWIDGRTIAGCGGDRIEREAALRSALRAAGVENDESCPTTRPRASVEYREMTGWGEGRTWHDAAQDLRTAAGEIGAVDVLFLGDTIAQDLTGHTDRVSASGGQRPIDLFAGSRKVASFGLAGDRTEHVLFRVIEGDLDALEPRVIVLQVGAQNLVVSGHSPDETVEGIVAVIGALRERFPSAHIVECGPLPAGNAPDSRARRAIVHTHALLSERDLGARVEFLDLRPSFLRRSGALREDLLSRDGLSITRQGQFAWLDALQPTIDGALGF